MCWEVREEEGRSLISGSQNNCLPLFLIRAEDPTGHYIIKVEKVCPEEKRRKILPRTAHLHTLYLGSLKSLEG